MALDEKITAENNVETQKIQKAPKKVDEVYSTMERVSRLRAFFKEMDLAYKSGDPELFSLAVSRFLGWIYEEAG